MCMFVKNTYIVTLATYVFVFLGCNKSPANEQPKFELSDFHKVLCI